MEQKKGEGKQIFNKKGGKQGQGVVASKRWRVAGTPLGTMVTTFAMR